MDASAVLDRVRDQLHDTNSDRWSDTTLLRYLNDSFRVIATKRPNLLYKRNTFQLQTGPSQVLPSDGIRLLSVRRYMGTTGSDPGPEITEVRVEDMDRFLPGWRGTKQKAMPIHHVVNPQKVNHFEVYPPNDGNGHVEADYSYQPAEITSTSDSLETDDELLTALVNYVAWQALAQDDEFGVQAAQIHQQNFFFEIGLTRGQQDNG